MKLKNNFLVKKLTELKKANLYRTLKASYPLDETYINYDHKKYISFCSNDYLGLSQNKQVKQAAIQAIDRYGFGAGASRYVSGNNSLYFKLEKILAKLKYSDDAIVFGSGYLTAIGIIPALADRKDLIIADKLIHSCLIDGSKLTAAKFLRFDHNDIASCRSILIKHRQNYQRCLIITETVFSMCGNLGKIQELLDLAVQYDCLLISDDAHGMGVVKQERFDNYKDIYLQLGTLSKAVGGYGGYICGNELIIDYLRNFAKSAIYSTALPPAILAGNLQALKIISKDQQLAKKALKNANYFCKILNLAKPTSTIIVIITHDANKTLEIAAKIADNGFLVSAIRPPTVEQGKARLRITFSALHHKDDIKKLAACIFQYKDFLIPNPIFNVTY